MPLTQAITPVLVMSTRISSHHYWTTEGFRQVRHDSDLYARSQLSVQTGGQRVRSRESEWLRITADLFVATSGLIATATASHSQRRPSGE
jgi:hypothetical protein